MAAIHRNPEEYQRIDEFLPQRFDPNDPLYLTPGGKERHKGSFKPFAYGPRKCLGYLFAGVAVPSFVLNMVNTYDLVHMDEKNTDPKTFPKATVF